MQTKDDKEEVELKDDSDYSDEEAEHEIRSLRLRKGQLESHVESSEMEGKAEMKREVRLVATTGMQIKLTKKQKAEVARIELKRERGAIQ